MYYSHLDIKRIQVSNILEDSTDDNIEKLSSGGFHVTLKAFQILTLKVDLN